MTVTLLYLLFYSLACYRLAVLLSEDTGPSRIFQKLRAFLKREAQKHPAVRRTAVHEGIECLRCSSVWVATPVAVYAYYHDRLEGWFIHTGDIFLTCMALSALSILWHRAFPKR